MPELELWQVADVSWPEKLDDHDPSTHVLAASTAQDTIAPDNCASFAIDINTSPTLYRRAHLRYSTTGVVRSFALERTINGLARQGGNWLAGDTAARETSEEIDPSVLVPGSNEVRICVPRAATADVTVSDLRIVGKLDLGIALATDARIEHAGTEGSAVKGLVDRDPASTVAVAAGD